MDQKAWYSNVVNAFYAAAIGRDTVRSVHYTRRTGNLAVPSGALSFSDTYGHTELNSATAYGKSMGWINGYEDGMFRPNASLIRAETAKLLNRATRRPPPGYELCYVLYGCYWAYSEIQSAANYV